MGRWGRVFFVGMARGSRSKSNKDNLMEAAVAVGEAVKTSFPPPLFFHLLFPLLSSVAL